MKRGRGVIFTIIDWFRNNLFSRKRAEQYYAQIDLNQQANGSNKITTNAIYILGECEIYDNNGDNIVKKFTPILKDLLAILIVSTQKEGGITSQALEETLWRQKDKTKARNCRGVNINRLRREIANIRGISVIHQSGSWRIETTPDLFCDYQEISEVQVRHNSTELGLESESNSSLIHYIISRGTLLQDLNYEMIRLENIRISNISISILEEYIEAALSSGLTSLIYSLNETIISIDSLNENALQRKCMILYNSGRLTLAHKIYDRFKTSYKSLYNRDFSVTFNKLIST